MPRHSPYALSNLIAFFALIAFLLNCFFCSFVFGEIFLLERSHIFFCYLVFKDQLLRKFLNSLKTKQTTTWFYAFFFLLRKEVIHPHVPVGIPCYDLTPIIGPTLDGSLLTVRPPASGITNSHGLTGGVYKTRERIHRGMLIRDY